MVSSGVEEKIPRALRLSPRDNVAIAVRPIPKKSKIAISGQDLLVQDPIPAGHKFALTEIPPHSPVLKYGQIIGFASTSIPTGTWIHVHNCSAERFERDYAFSAEVPPPPVPQTERFFEGYLRPDGKAGTRNFVAVISTVNCSATVCRAIAEAFRDQGLREYPRIDGVFPVTHNGGCAMQHGGPDHVRLEKVLGGLARHPNIAAYLLVGLGCETGQTSRLLQTQRLVNVDGSPRDGSTKPFFALSIQDLGGTRKTVEAGIAALQRLLPAADDAHRTRIPAAKLILGTNCGGSDGSSGITANPALGVASDLLVAQGGTTIIGETPEIYGAEHLLTRRAVSRDVGEKLVDRIRWWEWYTSIFGAEINNNPSPGNKEGGLTTIYEKSLGAIAKGGSTALTAVYEYADPVTAKGFVVMDTPGFDPTSMTGIVAGGANVCVFTTGRGSVYGCKPAPSIKVSTNTPLYEKMSEDMDLDAGTVFSGVPLEEVGRRIFEEILAVASGKKTKSEIAGMGDEEFSPWIIGPIL